MALRTLQRDVCARQREAGGGVIESGIRPGHRGVAGFARLRHSSLHVIGVGRSLVVLQMAGDACGVGEAVVSVDVALRTLQRDVRAGQREAGLAVIEGRVGPGRRSVATLAGLRQGGLHVIGVGGSLIVLEVAGHASSYRQAVVAVHMTLRAWGRDVHTGQRETSLAVIESGIGPRSRVVAAGAGGGNSGLRVVGVGGALEILHVAGCTIRRSAGELSVHMALGAGHSGVRPGQGKFGKGVVIESGRLPGGGGVTALARLREPCLHVIRVGCFLEVGKMAAYAGGGRARELASDVTGGAIQRNMRSRQCKAGDSQVVKRGARPAIETVTLFTGRGEPGGHVIWTRGGLILLSMAGVALGGQAHELPGGSSFVAGGAVQHRMGPEQRKTILVLVDLLHGNLPAFHAVTLLTICPKLAFMNVGVTIGALVTHVGEHRLDMTLRATDPLMHATQREPGLVMVELGHVANRLPAAHGVAILARDIERAVRATGVGVGLRLPPRGQDRDQQQQRDKQVSPDRRSQRNTA